MAKNDLNMANAVFAKTEKEIKEARLKISDLDGRVEALEKEESTSKGTSIVLDKESFAPVIYQAIKDVLEERDRQRQANGEDDGCSFYEQIVEAYNKLARAISPIVRTFR